MSFFKELKRRNVFHGGIVYTVATWLLIQFSDTVYPRIGLPGSAVTLVIALLVNEQHGPSPARLHVAEKGSGTFTVWAVNVPDPFSDPFSDPRVGTSLRQGKEDS